MFESAATPIVRTRPAIPGGTVCRFHGGAAPQVQASARARLAALVDPAINYLGKALKQRAVNPVGFAAARDVLDRNGFKPKEVIETQVTTYDLDRLANLSDDELQRFLDIAGKLATAGSTPGGSDSPSKK